MTGRGAPAPLTIPRGTLVARVLAESAPIVVIEGPPGIGKSRLLAEIARALGATVASDVKPPGGPLVLWDVPHVAQTAPLPAAPGRLILARRPDTAIPGLARATVYGHVATIPAEALILTEADLLAAGLDPARATGIMARTGGWACLIPAVLDGRAGQGALTDFLRDELLDAYPSAALAAFEAHLADPRQRIDARLLAGLPFVRTGAELHPALAAVKAPMLRALRQLLSLRAGTATEARAIAVTQAALGRTDAAIATFQSVGAWQAAVQSLSQAGGPYFLYRFGPEAFDRMLAGFPPDLLASDDTLVLSRALQAVKNGEVPLMIRVLADRWGEQMSDFNSVIADRGQFSLEIRMWRLLLRIWEDFQIPDDFLARCYPLLAELSPEDDLRRGSFYNTVLEYYIRTRRLPEAELVALRALHHYSRANVPFLNFFIDLHLGIIRQMQGDLTAARSHAVAAGRHLRGASFESPGDRRLLALLDACIDFETGTPETLQRFLSLELDALAQGEIWPTLVELVLTYGAQALAETYTPLAARAFLDRWRVRQEQSSQFRSLIDIREVGLMQSAGRWAEAGQKAAAIPGRATLAFVQAGVELATIADRDEIAMSLIWLRQMAQLQPQDAGLDGLMAAMLDNAHLTGRQRLSVTIWRAHVARRQRRLAEAESQLLRVLGQAAAAGAVATVTEERIFLTELLSVRRLREAAEASEPVRRLLRRLTAAAPARAAGLTRQETRMLRAIGEGAATKTIATMMGLSESTVKFHLANLYRKLGATSRREAVRAATALRLLT